MTNETTDTPIREHADTTGERQAMANRRNAQKSTGPKTDEGKATARLNALKHGLLSAHVLLPNEDAGALADFAACLRSSLAPVGDVEALLADRIISSAWRLRRLMAVEAGLFRENEALFRFAHENDPSSPAEFFRQRDGSFLTLSRYEATLERGVYRALHELQRLQAVREGNDLAPPVAMDVDLDVTVREGSTALRGD